jgi:hypothetical protein
MPESISEMSGAVGHMCECKLPRVQNGGKAEKKSTFDQRIGEWKKAQKRA